MKTFGKIFKKQNPQEDDILEESVTDDAAVSADESDEDDVFEIEVSAEAAVDPGKEEQKQEFAVKTDSNGVDLQSEKNIEEDETQSADLLEQNEAGSIEVGSAEETAEDEIEVQGESASESQGVAAETDLKQTEESVSAVAVKDEETSPEDNVFDLDNEEIALNSDEQSEQKNTEQKLDEEPDSVIEEEVASEGKKKKGFKLFSGLGRKKKKSEELESVEQVQDSVAEDSDSSEETPSEVIGAEAAIKEPEPQGVEDSEEEVDLFELSVDDAPVSAVTESEEPEKVDGTSTEEMPESYGSLQSTAELEKTPEEGMSDLSASSDIETIEEKDSELCDSGNEKENDSEISGEIVSSELKIAESVMEETVSEPEVAEAEVEGDTQGESDDEELDIFDLSESESNDEKEEEDKKAEDVPDSEENTADELKASDESGNEEPIVSELEEIEPEVISEKAGISEDDEIPSKKSKKKAKKKLSWFGKKKKDIVPDEADKDALENENEEPEMTASESVSLSDSEIAEEERSEPVTAQTENSDSTDEDEFEFDIGDAVLSEESEDSQPKETIADERVNSEAEADESDSEKQNQDVAASVSEEEEFTDSEPLFSRIAHVCLNVKNLQRSISYYTKLGFRKKFCFHKDGNLYGVYLEFGSGNFIELFENKELDLDLPNARLAHFCLETDDIEKAMKVLESRGIEFTEKKLGCDSTYQIWLTDPDGNKFELHQYTDKSSQIIKGDVEVDW